MNSNLNKLNIILNTLRGNKDVADLYISIKDLYEDLLSYKKEVETLDIKTDKRIELIEQNFNERISNILDVLDSFNYSESNISKYINNINVELTNTINTYKSDSNNSLSKLSDNIKEVNDRQSNISLFVEELSNLCKSNNDDISIVNDSIKSLNEDIKNIKESFSKINKNNITIENHNSDIDIDKVIGIVMSKIEIPNIGPIKDDIANVNKKFDELYIMYNYWKKGKVSFRGGLDGIEKIIAGDGISIDNTNQKSPIISITNQPIPECKIIAYSIVL